MTNQIVILAGGEGKRMGGKIPKVLVMLKNKPLVLHLLHELEKVPQLAKPVIVVGYKYQDVRGVLGDDYLYAYQNKQLGTAHALLCAKLKVKAENILVLYGDMPFIRAKSLKALLAMHFKKRSSISMLVAEAPNFRGKYKSLEQYGKIIRDSGHKIVKIVECKNASAGQKKIKEINPGIYAFNTKWLWENLKNIKNNNTSKEYYLTDIVEVAIQQGLEIANLSIDPKEAVGINSPEDLEIAESIAQVGQ